MSTPYPAAAGGASDPTLRTYVARRDPAAREAVIAAHLPLVRRLARRYCGRGEGYDDLVQAGCVGLVKAVDRFDPARGAFMTYAVPTIVGEIRRHLRDRGGGVATPRRIRELAAAVHAVAEAFTASHCRSPTVDELADELDVDAEDVVEALVAVRARRTVPLLEGGDDGAADAGACSLDTIGGRDAGYEFVEDRAAALQGLRTLDDRERQIVALTFFGGHSQTRIAQTLGMSQMHVSRLLRRALAKARAASGADPVHSRAA